MRRGVGTGIVAVLAFGLAACHAGGSSGAVRAAAAVCAQPVVPASRTTAAARSSGTVIAQPGGGGAITVTAIGFSQNGGGMLSIGAEVGNSGTRIAYDTNLVFHAFDTGHVDVLDERTVTIPVLLPGARVPVGLSATSTFDVAWASYPKVRSVRADLIRTQWLPATGVGEFPRVSVRVIPPLVKVGPAQVVTEVRLAGRTNACVSEPATRVGIVYRDNTGAIVGGAVATTADVSRTVAFSGCTVGGFGGGVFAYGPLPAKAEFSRTDVALYCDPAKSVRDTGAPME